MAAVTLAGCNKGDTSAAEPVGLAPIRAAIVAHNYAEAAELARKEAAQRPKEPAAQFELARAEALLGNEGRALDALEAAVAAGLPDAVRAMDDPAFTALAGSDRFSALLTRALPTPTVPATGTISVGAGADHVEIRETSNGTHIQAGDVKLDTDF